MCARPPVIAVCMRVARARVWLVGRVDTCASPPVLVLVLGLLGWGVEGALMLALTPGIATELLVLRMFMDTEEGVGVERGSEAFVLLAMVVEDEWGVVWV